MKHNIGQKLALYPTPATVVGTVGEGGKINRLLVAHVGIVSHSKMLLSIHSSHHSIKAIDESKRLSVNIIDEALLLLPTIRERSAEQRLTNLPSSPTIWARQDNPSLNSHRS